jgi:hypothetical protein
LTLNPPPPPSVQPPFDWQSCVAALTPEHRTKLAEWRDYSPDFVAWLHAHSLVGLFDGERIAFPVHNASGQVDDFLRTPGQPYLSQYKASDLAEHFSTASPPPKIIEGVVLLDALEFLGASVDVLVFATRLINGNSEYAQYLQDPKWQPKSSSTREIVDYYRRREPWKSAQLLPILQKVLQPAVR